MIFKHNLCLLSKLSAEAAKKPHKMTTVFSHSNHKFVGCLQTLECRKLVTSLLVADFAPFEVFSTGHLRSLSFLSFVLCYPGMRATVWQSSARARLSVAGIRSTDPLHCCCSLVYNRVPLTLP